MILSELFVCVSASLRENENTYQAGTRIPVTVILDQLADTGSIDALARTYPELTRELIAGALKYCHTVIEHTELEPELA